MPSRCDLHVHSKRSDRPSEWYLAQLGAPESFTEPMALYRLARERGMDFVTISDHDTIDGALEIAHLEGVFLSCEVTAAFPEDGCEIHLLVWGIDEEEHREIQRLRRDLFELRRYLRARDIAHGVAHPLCRVNGALTIGHLEKLLVLFRRFELVNGQRDRRESDVFHALVSALDRHALAAMADRHRLEIEDEQPAIKWLTGGSDDHSGLYVATTWTETPACRTVAEFLARLASGEHLPGGEHGGSLKLARSLQSLAHDYYRQKVLGGSRWRNDPVAGLLRRLLDGELGAAAGSESAWARNLRAAADFLPSWTPSRAHLRLLKGAGHRRRAESAVDREAERAVFEGASRLGQRALARAAETASAAFAAGRPIAALGALTSLSASVMALSPYVAAFRFQHRDEDLLATACDAFPAARPLRRRGSRVAWATDTLFEVNGVARTVRSVAALARRTGAPLTVVTAGMAPRVTEFDLESLSPIWELPLPRYEEIVLRLPPVVEMIELFERERFGEIVVSTPGPVGLTALAAARLLRLPVTGIHHTDFPRYLGAMEGGAGLVDLAEGLLGRYFRAMDRVLVASRLHRAQLAAMGVADGRLADFPHGVDTERFDPARRRRSSGDGRLELLYVGRLAPEKNLRFLLAAFVRLEAIRPGARLTLAGDGPEREALEALAPPGVRFTGWLHGEELAATYADADLFVFPSRTDTFGNAVLEALASGVPALVAAEGGPAEQIVESGAGAIADAGSVHAWSAALSRLAGDPELRRELGARGRRHAESRSWRTLLDVLMRRGDGAEAAVPSSPVAPRELAAT
jgi:glycosyltransferase involved in cell wall biosynthesis